MAARALRLGVDLGGSKIEIAAFSEDGNELLRRRVTTPKDDYRVILATVAELVESAERELGAQATVGIGTPGSLSRVDGRLRNSNTVCLNGQPLQQDLGILLHREVRIANDANCFALSEAVDGAAAGAAVVFGVIVGTGTGGGVVVDGKVLAGPNGIAGEWGHNPLPWPRDDERPGPACYCGKRGCIETFLSGPGMKWDHAAATAQPLEPPMIYQGAAAGDSDCVATLQRYVDRMARSLAQVINILDPDVVVLGGGMSSITTLYDAVPARWGDYAFSDRVDTRLVQARHGDSSGVRGAAWLWGR